MNYHLGQIVYYCLHQRDVDRIREQRGPNPRGNFVSAGEEFPCIITKIWDPEFHPSYLDGAINGQVLLDGPDTLWVTSVEEVVSEIEFRDGWHPGSGHHVEVYEKRPGNFRVHQRDVESA